MAIDFPSGPSVNQIFTDPTSGKSWKWDGEKWVVSVTGLTAADIPNSSITSAKLNVTASGSTGNILTRNTGATSGFEWADPALPAYSWTSYTPTWTQSATITKTTNWARYVQIGKMVQVSIRMTSTGSGTASNTILIGLPVNASSNNFLMGQLLYTPAAGTNALMRNALYNNTSTVAFSYQFNSTWATPSARWGDATIGTTIASGDVVNVFLTYEAA